MATEQPRPRPLQTIEGISLGIVGLKVIVDTNIFFSAIIYPDGSENKLFELVDKNKLKIVICDYVLDEA